MANLNKPFGLAPWRYLNGAAYNGAVNVYFIPSTDTNSYSIGDPVATSSGAADTNGVSAVTLATAGAGNAVRGVIISMGGTVEGATYSDPANLSVTVIPATKTQAYYVAVVDDPNVLFTIQEFSGVGSTNFTAADIGKNANLKSGTNPNVSAGFGPSGWVLDDTAPSATTANYQLRLMGIERVPGNAFGNYCVFVVRINNHELNAAVAGV